MRLWLSFVLLTTIIPATAAVSPYEWVTLPKSFPPKVRAFMMRRAGCRADVESAKEHCRSINADEMALRKAYAGNPSVLRFIDISRDWDVRNAPPPSLTETAPTPGR